MAHALQRELGQQGDRSDTCYRIINEEVRRALGGHHCAKAVLVSLDFAEVRELQLRGGWDEAGALLADGAVRLEAATALPLLHIADAVGARAGARRGPGRAARELLSGLSIF